MNKIFDEIEDLVLYYATDDYDYKKSVALFNVGKIEKMVDYCRYLQHQLEEKEQENQQLKKQKDDVVEYINFLYIINQNINGKFSDTLWGQEILELLGEIDVED